MFYLVAGLRYLLFNPDREQHKYVLGCLLLIWSLELLKDAVTQFFPLFADTYVRRLYLLFDIIAIPLCALYVTTAICQGDDSSRRRGGTRPVSDPNSA